MREEVESFKQQPAPQPAAQPAAVEKLAVEEPAVIEAAIAPVEAPQLTRKQLGKRFKVSRETIRKWEESGKLAEEGWELVPGTGTSPNDPRKYRPVESANQLPHSVT